jgi:hypothetical protein
MRKLTEDECWRVYDRCVEDRDRLAAENAALVAAADRLLDALNNPYGPFSIKTSMKELRDALPKEE